MQNSCHYPHRLGSSSYSFTASFIYPALQFSFLSRLERGHVYESSCKLTCMLLSFLSIWAVVDLPFLRTLSIFCYFLTAQSWVAKALWGRALSNVNENICTWSAHDQSQPVPMDRCACDCSKLPLLRILVGVTNANTEWQLYVVKGHFNKKLWLWTILVRICLNLQTLVVTVMHYVHVILYTMACMHMLQKWIVNVTIYIH